MALTSQKRTKGDKDRDYAFISDLYCKGYEFREIAKKLNTVNPYSLSHVQVFNDVKLIVARWREYAAQAIDVLKAEELSKINKLEKTYWEAWERSLKPRLTKSKEIDGTPRKNALPGEEQYTITKQKKYEREEESDGNPAYIAGIQWCVNKRCEILGLDAPKKKQLSGDEDNPVVIKTEGGELQKIFSTLPEEKKLRIQEWLIDAVEMQRSQGAPPGNQGVG